MSHYTHAINRVLLIYRRLPHVERLIHFIILTAATSPFTAPTLSYLLDLSNATAPAVRFRVMQILAGVLASLEDDAELEEYDLFDKITEVVLSRINDRVARVRAAAAAAACRLQVDGNLRDDVVAAELARMCKSDSSGAVRKAALKSLAMEHGNWAYAVGRTRDVRADVRRAAYEILGRGVRPDVFGVTERVGVLKDGLSDRDAGVRKVVQEVLLAEGWLNGACGGNIVNLATLLGGREREYQVLEVLKTLFREKNCGVKSEDVSVDVNALEVEDVLVMRAMSEALGEGALDRFFDSTRVYVEVLRYYRGCDAVCRHLLETCKCMDMADEAGRKELENLLKVEFVLSDEIEEQVAEGAVRAMRCAMLEEEATLRILLEIVGFLVPFRGGEGERQVEQQGERSVDAEKNIHSRDDEQLTVVEWEAEHSDCIQIEGRAGTGEQEWKELRALTVCREAFRMCRQGQSFDSPANSLVTSLLELGVLPHVLGVDQEMRYMAMECMGLYCLLDSSGLQARQKLPLFVRASKVDVLEIQELAIRIIVDFFMVFDFPDKRDEGSERNSSAVNNAEVRRKSATRRQNAQDCDVSSLAEECINILSQSITHSDSSMRSIAVKGLARLLFLRRIIPTATLLSRLLIVYHNPMTEDDDELRQCLSVFFPAFAASSPTNRLRLEDTFKQTLEVISTAPVTSPVSMISVTQVAQFVIHLTNRDIASAKQDQRGGDLGRSADQIHERLAEMVLNDIIDATESYEVELGRTYGRILSNFRLVCDAENMAEIKMLLKLTQSALRECNDKRLMTMLKRFRDRLTSAFEKARAAGIEATADTFAEAHVMHDIEDNTEDSKEQSDEDESGTTTQADDAAQGGRDLCASRRQTRSSRRKPVDDYVNVESAVLVAGKSDCESEDSDTSGGEDNDGNYHGSKVKESVTYESKVLRPRRRQTRTTHYEAVKESENEDRGERDSDYESSEFANTSEGDKSGAKQTSSELRAARGSRVFRSHGLHSRAAQKEELGKCGNEERSENGEIFDVADWREGDQESMETSAEIEKGENDSEAESELCGLLDEPEEDSESANGEGNDENFNGSNFERVGGDDDGVSDEAEVVKRKVSKSLRTRWRRDVER